MCYAYTAPEFQSKREGKGEEDSVKAKVWWFLEMLLGAELFNVSGYIHSFPVAVPWASRL